MTEIDLILNYPFKGNVLVDVGAHVGSFARPFVLRGWQAVCLEPEKENYTQLVNNLPGVTYLQLAAGAERASLPFYVSSEHFGIHSLAAWHNTHVFAYDVQVVPLKEIVPDNVTLLKVDVESAELPVLKGFDFEAQQPEMIFLEFEDKRTREHFGYDHHDLVNYLKPYGYKVQVSEWTDGEFGTKAKRGTRRHIGIFDYPLDHEPVWGNLIFTKEMDED